MARSEAGRRLGKALGVLSLGLGLPQVLAPDAVNRLIGVKPTDGATTAMRSVGLQELTVGAAILARTRPAGWLWSRVAGDLLHLAMLRSAMGARGNDEQKLRRAVLAVAGVGLLDLIAAVRLTRSRSGPLHTASTVTINRPPEDVYARWRDFSQLPSFMAHLESVEQTSDDRWHWVARAPGGRRVEWDAEIVEDAKNELISWRSVAGDVPNTGSVRFTRAAGNRGTEVTVELTYDPPAGRAGVAVATLLGEAPEQQVRDDLRRFKQLLEIGEVLRSDGAPEGLLSKRQLKQQAARPSR